MKEFLECGKIVSTHGVRGEVKAEVWMDSPEEMTALKTLYLDGGKTPLTVKGARVHKNMVLLTLAGVETPEAGSALRQKVLFARREDIPLERGNTSCRTCWAARCGTPIPASPTASCVISPKRARTGCTISALPMARCGWPRIFRRWCCGWPRRRA